MTPLCAGGLLTAWSTRRVERGKGANIPVAQLSLVLQRLVFLPRYTTFTPFNVSSDTHFYKPWATSCS
jgi:hypothetical protein